MSKVDWITWKTDPKEIINPEKIIEEVEEYYQNYDATMNSMIYEPLKNDMSSGGLSKDAFNISGISPANAIAQDIVSKIEDIKINLKDLEESILESAKNQKEIEKKQLVESIEDKIKKEELFLKSIEGRRGVKEQMIKMGNNPDDIIDIIKDRIEKLKERLEMAQSL